MTESDTPIRIELEVRPQDPVAARYDQLPFPLIAPVQEIALDVGIVAIHGSVVLSGLVVKGYNGHQLLFEQRWPARIIRQRLGAMELTIDAGTGLALRSLHFLLHGHEPLTHLELTAIAQSQADGNRTVQAVRQVPVRYHEQETDLHFPLAGVWWAIQTGDWSDTHKTEVYSQPYAIDLVMLGANGLAFAGSGRELADHFSWDQPVYATAGGKVALASYDMPDVPPGTIADPAVLREEPRRILGNAVAISHANGEFSFYGHLRQASLQVAVGDMVRRGALIGRVGNSGQSPGPHLHFHLMNGPNLFIDQGLPFQFSHFSAGGEYFDEPTTIPTRMIVVGPERD